MNKFYVFRNTFGVKLGISLFEFILTKPFHDGGRYHIETESMDWFLHDNGLRHERVKPLSGTPKTLSLVAPNQLDV